MGKGTLSANVRLDGEKEYRDAIKNINAGIGVLNSELKKNAAEFKDNADSVEALTAKGDALERKLSSQREKVEELRKALAFSAEQYGEADAKTMSWAKQLNEAEAAAFNTESAIRENNKALDEAKKKTDENTMSVGDLIDSLGIKLPEGADKALSGMLDFSVGSAAKLSLVVAAVKEIIDSVNALIDITKEAAGYVDNLATTSVTSGIDTYTLQVLSYMEDLADTDMSTVTDSMTKLTRSMSDAAAGGAKTSEAFAQLGVNIEAQDGHLRDATDVFWEAVDALGRIGNDTERDATAMALFGRSAQDLNVLIGIGSDGFREYAREAENVGYILSEKDLKALNDYQDALDRTKKQQEAINQQMAAEMAPGLQELTEGWQNLKSEGLQLVIDSHIIDFLSDLCKVIGTVIGFVGDLLEAFNMLMHPIETIKDLLGLQNETLEENAKMSKAATVANDNFKNSVSGDSYALNATANAANNAANSLRQYAIAAGYTANISDKRLAELGSYSEANEYRGAGFFGNYANMNKDEFKTLLNQNGITSASKISTVLGEDAYRYYLASATYHNASGDYNFVGGWTELGENGPETVFLPRGTRISNAQETRAADSSVYVTVYVDHLDDVVQLKRIITEARQMARMR